MARHFPSRGISRSDVSETCFASALRGGRSRAPQPGRRRLRSIGRGADVALLSARTRLLLRGTLHSCLMRRLLRGPPSALKGARPCASHWAPQYRNQNVSAYRPRTEMAICLWHQSSALRITIARGPHEIVSKEATQGQKLVPSSSVRSKTRRSSPGLHLKTLSIEKTSTTTLAAEKFSLKIIIDSDTIQSYFARRRNKAAAVLPLLCMGLFFHFEQTERAGYALCPFRAASTLIRAVARSCPAAAERHVRNRWHGRLAGGVVS